MVSRWLIFSNNQLLLCKQNETYTIPDSEQLKSLKFVLLRQYTLGLVQNIEYYCAEMLPDVPLSEDMIWLPLKKSFLRLSENWFSLVAKAFQIIAWDKNHSYCGRCGHKTILKVSNGFERSCAGCDLIFYPRISPSVIVLIKKDNRILMARSPHFTPGVYGLIAGFIEAGENAEEALHREVKEEVNIEIKNIRYFGSQAWPFPDSLILAFTADYAAGEIKIDNIEIESAGWYPLDNLPGLPSYTYSIARRLIDSAIF